MFNKNSYSESLLFRRRSIRKFKEREVEEWKIQALLEAGFSTQTAKNQMEMEFVVVQNQVKINQLMSRQDRNAVWACNAPLVLVVTSCENYQSLPAANRIEQDLGAVSHQVCLMAEELELGSTWCGMYPNALRCTNCREDLGIPETVMIFSLIVIGYPDEVKSPNYKFIEEKVHRNQW